MTERRKLSLGAVSERAEHASSDPTRAWKVSPARAAALKDRARTQRRHPSEAQALLWSRLGDKQLGFTFTREVVMGSTIADFACKPRWLVIETGGTDGPEATLGELSDRKLTEVGVRVLRFSDEQVLGDVDAVLAAIAEELAKPFERPKIAAAARPQRTYR
jgi:leucyl-tRNA synthetase